ncbi:MAG: RNA polymerase sigma factor [Candidatus Magasanikbacteria bacterium]|nr:RNA polymerase sigma factor [Candidatus Magasanikbacteria bacterium]
MESPKYFEPQKTESTKEAWLAELNSDTTISYIKNVIRHTNAKMQNADIEDITQDTLIQANKALDAGNFKGESSLKTWIFRIAKNLTISHIRKQNIRAKYNAGEQSEVEAVSPAYNPEEIAINREQLKNFEKIFLTLTPIEQEILNLKLAGHTTAQISQKLNKNPGTIRVIIHRIKQKIADKNIPT